VADQRRPDTRFICGWPFAEFAANKKDVERHYREVIELVPAFADRLRAAKREARYVGTGVPNFFRKPFGPGWALVGDAGYNKDFITAQGIQDAFRDAELCIAALEESFSGARSFDVAMGEYQSTRDEHVLPMYEFTTQLATLQPPPPELQQLLAAVQGNPEAMEEFARVNGGVTSPAVFFSDWLGPATKPSSDIEILNRSLDASYAPPGMSRTLGRPLAPKITTLR
jgi:2-polyprenyl-6-methoxyphenol hydroxylase-like FAD-dependent oxidoreductase